MDRMTPVESIGGEEQEAGGIVLGAAVEIGVETKSGSMVSLKTREESLKSGLRNCTESH